MHRPVSRKCQGFCKIANSTSFYQIMFLLFESLFRLFFLLISHPKDFLFSKSSYNLTPFPLYSVSLSCSFLPRFCSVILATLLFEAHRQLPASEHLHLFSLSRIRFSPSHVAFSLNFTSDLHSNILFPPNKQLNRYRTNHTLLNSLLYFSSSHSILSFHITHIFFVLFTTKYIPLER